MISREIREAESGADMFVKDIESNELEFRKRREEARWKREQEAAAREEERTRARRERRRVEEERLQRERAELKRQEEEEARCLLELKRKEEQAQSEFKSALRIQAHVRGRRSRAGIHTASPVMSANLHTTSLMSSRSVPSVLLSEPKLLT